MQSVMGDPGPTIDLYQLRQRLLGESIPADYGETAEMLCPEESA